MQLYTRQQIHALEHIAITEYALTEYTLMQRAGAAALATLQAEWPDARRIIVVCGGGNNGGDGYVVAKLAHENGLQATACYIKSPEHAKGASVKAIKAAQDACVSIVPYDGNLLTDADVVVDAILGTGLQGKIKPEIHVIISTINQAKKKVIALDVPSGLDVNTGKTLGTCIKANITITFIAIKQGLLTGVAPDYTGKIICNNLQIPPQAFSKVATNVTRLTLNVLLNRLPKRHRSAHKGDFGHVLVVGGDYGFAGAARMAGEASARAGAGLVSVTTRPEQVPIINSARPELMCCGISNPTELIPLLKRATVVALGPGLGQSHWSEQLFKKILATKLPLILDADALNLLAQQPCQRENWILTPHPGEAARLLACTTPEIQTDRFASARALQEKFNGIVILKGAGSLIVNEHAEIGLCTAGNPGMATGGMGDVLTGLVAGLVAQHLDLYTAACLGVIVHAIAADRAAQQGERGTLALDLLPHIRRLLNNT